jgi:hypothetical protein
MFRRQAENESNQNETDGLLFFGGKDKNLAADWFWQGRRAAASAKGYQPLHPDADSAARCPYRRKGAIRLHPERRFTWSDRYFRRIFSS